VYSLIIETCNNCKTDYGFPDLKNPGGVCPKCGGEIVTVVVYDCCVSNLRQGEVCPVCGKTAGHDD